MKTTPLFARLVIPVLAALMLLPPLSCAIFHTSAARSARQEAEGSLGALTQSVLPLVDLCFGPARSAKSPDSVNTFLRRVSAAVRRMDTDAQLIILESQLKVIYPYDETERSEIAGFAALCAQHIPPEGQEDQVIELTDEHGGAYLLRFCRVPTDSARIRYLIAYCSISRINAWVADASRRVLIISFAFVAVVAVILCLAVRSITRPLSRLSQGVSQIGAGSFLRIEPPFRLRELESLRQATNAMSVRLSQAEKTQRDFLQNVSHELRNPLMSIGGYAQGIEHGVFSSPQSAAHTILEESSRMTALVDSLLTLSRLESDTRPMDSVRLIEPVQDSLDRLSGLVLKRGIGLQLLPFAEDIRVHGDEELISQVLCNLLSNAIRYARTAVTVSVGTDAERVVLAVHDDGEGIADKDLPHIFERCYKGAGGHFGIGLAIAAASAARMDGSLTARNAPEGGAIFELTLRQGSANA